MPPEAMANVYSWAGELARGCKLTDASAWFSPIEEESGHWLSLAKTVLATDGSDRLNPDFQGAPIEVAVALLPHLYAIGEMTPIAWTRGLRPDGT